MSINTGLEFNLKPDRVRFTPMLSFGYHSGNIETFSDEPLESLQIWPVQVETPIFLDLIRNNSKSFQWFIGLGLYGNLGLGSYLLGSIGGYTGTGFRIRPENSQFSIEILPINLMLGYGPYRNIFGRVSLAYDLDRL
jgi:hypothetical protein